MTPNGIAKISTDENRKSDDHLNNSGNLRHQPHWTKLVNIGIPPNIRTRMIFK